MLEKTNANVWVLLRVWVVFEDHLTTVNCDCLAGKLILQVLKNWRKSVFYKKLENGFIENKGFRLVEFRSQKKEPTLWWWRHRPSNAFMRFSLWIWCQPDQVLCTKKLIQNIYDCNITVTKKGERGNTLQMNSKDKSAINKWKQRM